MRFSTSSQGEPRIMKALVIAAVLVALSSTAVAGAAREARPQADTTVAVIADAGRLSSAGLMAAPGPAATARLPKARTSTP
jgi:hypothetical protein